MLRDSGNQQLGHVLSVFFFFLIIAFLKEFYTFIKLWAKTGSYRYKINGILAQQVLKILVLGAGFYHIKVVGMWKTQNTEMEPELDLEPILILFVYYLFYLENNPLG